jgi:5-hydroxyisourate hydrolase-like protein (transthyretin family)
VTGRVLDPAGQPVAGARLLVERVLAADPIRPEDVGAEEVGRTAADGTFRVTVPAPAREPRHYLLAHAPGFGVAWVEWDRLKPAEAVTFRLVKDQPITGRVLNTEGKPLAGVAVSGAGVYVPRGGRLDDFLDAWKRDWRDATVSTDQRLYLPLDAITGPARTDQDGRFTLTGAGAERIVHVTLAGEGLAAITPYVITRAGFDAKPYNAAARDDTPPGFRSRRAVPVLFGPEPTFVTEPGVTVTGTIKDAATGRPVAGCRVAAHFGYGDGAAALTDAAGRYTLANLPKEKAGYGIVVLPPKTSRYLNRWGRAADGAGFGPIRLDLELVEGAVVTGRVIDPRTGKGVPAGIRFAPMPGNPHFGAKPGFDNYRSDRTEESTDAEGRFRLLTIPGKALVLAQAHGGEKFHGQYLNPFRRAEPADADRTLYRYNAEDDQWTVATAGGLEILDAANAVQLIDVKAEGETTVDLRVDRGATATVLVQDGDGRPLAGAWVAGLTDSWPITYRLPGPSETVYALNPRKPRTLLLYHPERHLGGTVTVRGDEAEPVAVKLGPMGQITGRLRAADGAPLAGLDVAVAPAGPVARELYRFATPGGKAVRTDRDGRFTLAGVVPGMEFFLSARLGEEYYGGNPQIGRLAVQAGATRDLGDRTMEPQR